MSNYNQKTNVPVAVKTRSQMDLSHVTIASQDFGNIVPISCQYLVPGDEFNINVSEFTRVLPMVNPTFAKVDSVVRAFAVPINYIWKGFNNFISGSPRTVAVNSQASSVPNVPTFLLTDLRSIFMYESFSTVIGEGDSFEDSYDFMAGNGSPSVKTYYKFTAKGKKVYKLLCGLGYNVNFSDSSDVSFNVIYSNVKVSLLPLLAFAKFYLDWIVPARFLSQYRLLQSFIDASYVSSGQINLSALQSILDFSFDSFLDNDYFTASFENVAKTPNTIDSVVKTGLGGQNFMAVGAAEALGANYSQTSGYPNYFNVAALGKLQSLINRNMIAGDKFKDWLKTEFGITVNLDALQTSTYLGMFRNTMRIGDIMSTADTSSLDGAPIGAYAGRAALGGDGTFSYKATQHSILIVTHEIIPKPLYFQGLRPQCLMQSRFDFFQPEFDNLGVRAISKMELYSGVDISKGVGGETLMKNIFGFAPQYANLKFGYDNVIGDFRLGSMESSMSSWFLGRKFTLSNVLNSTPNINLTFCKVNGTTQASYDDMFAYQGTDVDHFYCLFDISIKANRPMISISDALVLDDEMNDRKVAINTNNNPNV